MSFLFYYTRESICRVYRNLKKIPMQNRYYNTLRFLSIMSLKTLAFRPQQNSDKSFGPPSVTHWNTLAEKLRAPNVAVHSSRSEMLCIYFGKHEREDRGGREEHPPPAREPAWRRERWKKVFLAAWKYHGILGKVSRVPVCLANASRFRR